MMCRAARPDLAQACEFRANALLCLEHLFHILNKFTVGDLAGHIGQWPL